MRTGYRICGTCGERMPWGGGGDVISCPRCGVHVEPSTVAESRVFMVPLSRKLEDMFSNPDLSTAFLRAMASDRPTTLHDDYISKWGSGVAPEEGWGGALPLAIDIEIDGIQAGSSGPEHVRTGGAQPSVSTVELWPVYMRLSALHTTGQYGHDFAGGLLALFLGKPSKHVEHGDTRRRGVALASLYREFAAMKKASQRIAARYFWTGAQHSSTR